VHRTGSQKETISTFVPPMFNGLWPLNIATRFMGGRLLRHLNLQLVSDFDIRISDFFNNLTG